MLRDGILDSRAVQSVSDSAMLLYYRLFSIADDYGCYDYDPAMIKGKAFFWIMDRWPEDRIAACLSELCTVIVPPNSEPLVLAYEASGRKYLHIRKFGQRTQSRPRFPLPPGFQTAPVAERKNGTANQSEQLPLVSQPTKPEASTGFDEWWKVWSEVRGTARIVPAQKVFKAVVTVENFTGCIECTQSYLESLDSPNKGFNPDTFLIEQAKQNFTARWPSKQKTTKMTPTQKAIAREKEAREKGKR